MATPFQPSRHWRSWRVLWKCRFTSYFTMAKNHLKSRILKRTTSNDIVWGSKGKDAVYLHKLRKCLSKAEDKDRKILFSFAQKLASARNRVAPASGA
jgi:hypothetical protein